MNYGVLDLSVVLGPVIPRWAGYNTKGCGELRRGICLKNLQGEDAQGEFTKPDLDGVLASLRRIRVAAESCLEDLRGDEGRFTTTSWQVTSEVSMNSELKWCWRRGGPQHGPAGSFGGLVDELGAAR